MRERDQIRVANSKANYYQKLLSDGDQKHPSELVGTLPLNLFLPYLPIGSPGFSKTLDLTCRVR